MGKATSAIKNISTRREEYAIARALEAAILCADSTYSANGIESEMKHAGRQRVVANFVNNVSEWQLENTMTILQLAMNVKKAGGLTWNSKKGHFDLGVPKRNAER